MLFPYEPENDEYAREGETFASYFRRSTRPEVRSVVATLEEWFRDYPKHEQAALAPRFSDKDERDQYAAFWELYLHQTLKRSGAALTCVPTVVGKPTPDFLVEGPEHRFYVEAVVAGPFGPAHSEERRVRAFLAELNKIQCGPWMLGLTLHSAGTATPPTRPLRGEIEQWLSTLDYAAEVQAASLPHYRFQERAFSSGDWAFDIQAWPGKKPQTERKDTRAIRVFGGGMPVLVENHLAIRREVHQKARKYDLDAPLIVAVLVHLDFAREDHVIDALFGSDQIQYSIDPRRLTISGVTSVRGRDGVWTDPKRESAKGLAGVVTAVGLGPSSIASCRPSSWANPFATRAPLAFPGNVPWNSRWIGPDRKLKREDSKEDLHDYFGLRVGWPFEVQGMDAPTDPHQSDNAQD